MKNVERGSYNNIIVHSPSTKLHRKFSTLFFVPEMNFKKEFLKRERVDNTKFQKFYSESLNLILKEEIKDLNVYLDTWPELCTTHSDWIKVPSDKVKQYLPDMEESLPFHVTASEAEEEVPWRNLKRFEGDLVEGIKSQLLFVKIVTLKSCSLNAEE